MKICSKYHLYIIFISLYSFSCSINNRGYKFLNEDKNNHLNEYDSTCSIINDTCAASNIQLVNYKQLLHYCADSKYALIYFFSPKCGNGVRNIKSDLKFASKNNIEFIPIALSFDLPEIESVRNYLNWKRPIFLLEYPRYGNGTSKSRKILARELLDSSYPIEAYAYYLIKEGTEVIALKSYSSLELRSEILSLIPARL